MRDQHSARLPPYFDPREQQSIPSSTSIGELMTSSACHLSIVSPVYRAEECLHELYRRLVETAERITPHFDLILVEDHGPDGSWVVLEQFASAAAYVVARTRRIKTGFAHVVAAYLAALSIPFSITLFFSIALGLVAWYLATRGLPTLPNFVLAATPVIAIAAFPRAVGMIGGNHGGIEFKFDGGQWIYCVMTWLLPLVAVSLVAGGEAVRKRPEIAIQLACLAVPTVLAIPSCPTQNAFSMKTGTLLCALAMPQAAIAFSAWKSDSLGLSAAMCIKAVLAIGFLHTAAYLAQFPVGRYGLTPDRVVTIPWN